jgi:hypothetical protein
MGGLFAGIVWLAHPLVFGFKTPGSADFYKNPQNIHKAGTAVDKAALVGGATIPNAGMAAPKIERENAARAYLSAERWPAAKSI